jgi:hypothetical protein
MRQIEKQILAAFYGFEPMTGRNTVVCVEKDAARIFLHDNLIASMEREPMHDNKLSVSGKVPVLEMTLAGWNTPTTRSRLNAILDGAYGRYGAARSPNGRSFRFAFTQHSHTPFIVAWWSDRARASIQIGANDVWSWMTLARKLGPLIDQAAAAAGKR